MCLVRLRCSASRSSRRTPVTAPALARWEGGGWHVGPWRRESLITQRDYFSLAIRAISALWALCCRNAPISVMSRSARLCPLAACRSCPARRRARACTCRGRPRPCTGLAFFCRASRSVKNPCRMGARSVTGPQKETPLAVPLATPDNVADVRRPTWRRWRQPDTRIPSGRAPCTEPSKRPVTGARSGRTTSPRGTKCSSTGSRAPPRHLLQAFGDECGGLGKVTAALRDPRAQEDQCTATSTVRCGALGGPPPCRRRPWPARRRSSPRPGRRPGLVAPSSALPVG